MGIWSPLYGDFEILGIPPCSLSKSMFIKNVGSRPVKYYKEILADNAAKSTLANRESLQACCSDRGHLRVSISEPKHCSSRATLGQR